VSVSKPRAVRHPPRPSEAEDAKPVVVAYVTSRFPEVTQTWLLRELNAVASDPLIECELFSLFPPMKRTGTAHPSAHAWLPRLRRPRPGSAVAALAWWLRRSPARTLRAVAVIVGGYGRRPALLVRALATVPIAAAHARSIVTLGIDRVHAHTATYPLLTAWICHRLTGVPYSFTAHAHDLFVDQSLLRRRLAAAEFAVAISDFNRGFLAAYGGDRRTPVHVIRCGIDLSAYRFRPRAPAANGRVRALCVAGLKEYKGHRVLLEALSTSDPALARIDVDLVGDGPERRSLEERVDALGLADRVKFHGALPEPAVTRLLDRADLFVLPSVIASDGTAEGLPVVLVEALAAGVPAVATRVTGVPELIRHGQTGLLAEPGSVADLQRAIRALLADPVAARARAEAGRAFVERNHDGERSAAALARLFCGRSPYALDFDEATG
jgi:colanic acid/amylovoran biosynthesis glycosyltransferase